MHPHLVELVLRDRQPVLVPGMPPPEEQERREQLLDDLWFRT